VCTEIFHHTLVGRRQPLILLVDIAVDTLLEAVRRRGRVDDLYGHLTRLLQLPEVIIELFSVVKFHQMQSKVAFLAHQKGGGGHWKDMCKLQSQQGRTE